MASILGSFFTSTPAAYVHQPWDPAPPVFTGSESGSSSLFSWSSAVDKWLAQIRTGCIKHDIPREHWPRAAQYYMSAEARARLDALQTVMRKVHGGQYEWEWASFKVAMRNMGWNIDPKATETVKVELKPGGGWWFFRPNGEVVQDSVVSPPPPSTWSSKLWPGLRRPSSMPHLEAQADKTLEKKHSPLSPKPALPKSPSREFFQKDPIQRSKSITRPTRLKPRPAASTQVVVPPTQTDTMATTAVQAAIWLINASNALDVLNTEHPKVMSTLSAILITAGTLPGIGGAALGTGAAVHAASAIAVGVGSWLKASQEASVGRHVPSG